MKRFTVEFCVHKNGKGIITDIGRPVVVRVDGKDIPQKDRTVPRLLSDRKRKEEACGR